MSVSKATIGILAAACVLAALVFAASASAATFTLAIAPNEFDAYPGETGVPSAPTPATVVVTEDGGPVSNNTFVAIGSSDATKRTVDGGGVTIPAGSTTAPIQYTALTLGQVTLTATLGLDTATATANVIPPTDPKMSVTPFATVNKVVGTTQNLAANFSLAGGITPSRVRWTVSGANSVGPVDVTNNTPNESDFGYMGTSSGTDTVTACYDPNNDSVCDNTKHATVTWVPASPTISTTASHGVPVGRTIHDTASLAAGFSEGGQITFRLYRPGDSTCAQPPLFHSVTPVSGNDSYGSSNYTPAKPGTYRWRAFYSGDSANDPVAGACGAPNESVTVVKAKPKLTTDTFGTVKTGQQVTDSALFSGGYKPTGRLTWRLYGPGDTSCSKAPVFQSGKTVSGNGAYGSAPFTPTAPGTYRWRASYPGDARNQAATPPCNASNESVTVTRR